MKFGITVRFAGVLALVGVLVSGLTGYYAYSTSRDLLVNAAESRLLTATKVLARQITFSLGAAARDVRMVAGYPLAAEALSLPASSPRRAELEANLAWLFTQILKTNPEYFQIRLIAAADHGMERVRVDRDAAGPVRVEGDDLQEKGQYPYVYETLKNPPHAVHVSPASINRERGAHAGQNKPSVQVSIPVHGGGGAPVGLVVINIDMNGTFTQLAADLPRDIDLYLTNRQGDFLVHPDPAKAFAFDRGQKATVQEQFPATAALFDNRSEHVVVTASSGQQTESGVVAIFLKQRVATQPVNSFFVLGLSQPIDVVLKESNDLGFSTLQIVLAFSVLSVILAALLARTVARPLNQMVHAVQRFAVERVRAPLPLDRDDEIGVLARSFGDMQRQIEEQMVSLQDKQSELNHLASHDTLTGLPNRRMFLDRLEHTLARARRTGESMALLFIDLDNFKEINDCLGHAAGDAALQAAARRMQGVVREVDTIARLGGDEFIILLDGAEDAAAVSQVAEKIIKALEAPVDYQDGPLQLGASIGISQYPKDGANATEIIAAADRAMYQAKNSGRNCYRLAG